MLMENHSVREEIMQHSENESRARLKMCSWIEEDFLFVPHVFFLLRKQSYLEFEKKKPPHRFSIIWVYPCLMVNMYGN